MKILQGEEANPGNRYVSPYIFYGDNNMGSVPGFSLYCYRGSKSVKGVDLTLNDLFSSNSSYVTLDVFTDSVLPFFMVVSPFFVDSKLTYLRIHRLLSIYTLFYCTSI